MLVRRSFLWAVGRRGDGISGTVSRKVPVLRKSVLSGRSISQDKFVISLDLADVVVIEMAF